MKLLTSPAGSFLTGTELADAVTRYARVLAERRTTDVVDIPVIAAGGRVRRVGLLIGWRARVSSAPAGEAPDEPLEIDTIVSIYSRASRIAPPRAVPFTREEFDRISRARPDGRDIDSDA